MKSSECVLLLCAYAYVLYANADVLLSLECVLLLCVYAASFEYGLFLYNFERLF